MDSRPHYVFRKSQHTVTFELPNDVFYDFMTLLKQVNQSISNTGYKLTGDDLICIALEDFVACYLNDIKAFHKRIVL